MNTTLRSSTEMIPITSGYKKEREILKNLWDTPIVPMDSVNINVKSELKQKDVATNEIPIIEEQIRMGFMDSNIKSAENVHLATTIASQLAVGTTAALVTKIDGNFFSPMMQALSGVIYGVHIGGFAGKYIVEPAVRPIIDTFRTRQQKKMIDQFYKSERIK
ncbi:MAG: hypothetical protein WC069_03665 [Candidatus Shapirobacteria bacterium]